MKKGIYLALLLVGTILSAFAYSYETTVPLPGKSIAGEKIQKESLFTAYAFAHRFAAPDCTSFAIVDTNVSKEKVDNKWQEVWTIQACSRTAYVPINFEIKPDEDVYAIDPMGVRVSEKTNN